MTADALEEACHADYPDRIYPITGFSEYAVSGGEPNTTENGYAGSEITGYSARTDTFTLRKFNLALQANLVANKDTLFDMYVFDKNNVIYGEDDGTDELAGLHYLVFTLQDRLMIQAVRRLILRLMRCIPIPRR